MTAPVGVVMARAAELDRRYRQQSVQKIRAARPTAAVGRCQWCGGRSRGKSCAKHRDLDALWAQYLRGYDL